MRGLGVGRREVSGWLGVALAVLSLASAAAAQVPVEQPETAGAPADSAQVGQGDRSAQAHGSPAVPTAAPAPDVSTLEGLLERLQQNVLVYLRSVPSFFCSEHVLAERQPKATMVGFERQTSDSVFRLRRLGGSAQAGEFEERRQIRLVNGKPPASFEAGAVSTLISGGRSESSPELGAQGLGGPSIVTGVFSNGLKLVTSQGRQCFRYKMLAARHGHETDPIVIQFSALPPKEMGSNCPPYEKTDGRVYVDHTLLRVVRIEKRTEGFQIDPATLGTWTWTADFAPVKLGEETFWMPKTVTSKAVSDEGGQGAQPGSSRQAATAAGATAAQVRPAPPGTTWRFTADYTDYRKLAAKVTLLPFDENQKLPAAETTPDEKPRP